MHKAHTRSTEQHLRYLERDGVKRDGDRGQLFSATSDAADRREFEERIQGDRHQFRVVISPEDGAQLGDLRTYARDLMSQVERDLETRLEWIGVDHWDTDQPHVQLVIRGRDEVGRDLVISPEYISHGMRARARELATEWLGPRTELEIRESLQREVTQERWTTLDQTLQSQARDGQIVIRDHSLTAQGRFEAGLLIGRADRLTQMGLATKTAPLNYTLAPQFESTLRTMGERGDIVRTLQRSITAARREYSIFDHQDPQARVVGRIAASRFVDALTDRMYLVVDGIDGKAHYVSLPDTADLEAYPRGAVVEVRGGVDVRPADRNIAKFTEDGTYRTERHLAAVQSQHRDGLDPQTYVASHVRRLEALRRAGIVERIEEGLWHVPADFMERARSYDAQRAGGAVVHVRSDRAIEKQVRALGATWLDQQLISPEVAASDGFGAEVRRAVAERSDFLIEQGLAERRGQGVVFPRNLLAVLRTRELDYAARQVESQTGLTYRPVLEGQPVSGIYRQTLSLASGRFAMLDDGAGFALVPWRPVIEQRLGKDMTATVRGDFVSFDFGRRGISR